jgi:hypothetical protein
LAKVFREDGQRLEEVLYEDFEIHSIIIEIVDFYPSKLEVSFKRARQVEDQDEI